MRREAATASTILVTETQWRRCAPEGSIRCRSRVIHVGLRAVQPFPLFTQLWTYRCVALIDAEGQSRHFALQKNSEPFRRSMAGIHTRLQGRGSFVRLTYINAFAFAL